MFNNNVLNIKQNSIQFDYGVLQHFYKNENLHKKPYILHLAGRNSDIRYNLSKSYLNYLNKITAGGFK